MNAPPQPLRPLAPARLVVWGFLLVVLDLNLGVVDVLPDVLGYAVLLLGLHRLAPVHPHFARARLAAVAGLVAAALGVVLRRTEEVTTGCSGRSPAS